jgi:DNA-binding HxlR family transcriptional regulator
VKKYSAPSCCVSEDDVDICTCASEGILDVVSKKWSLLIVGLLDRNKSLRYNQLREKLVGVSPKSLADRLKELEKAGIIRREVYPEVPARVEYSLTKDGEELRQRILPFLQWSSRRTQITSRT